jgi:flagellar hook protein FlgE
VPDSGQPGSIKLDNSLIAPEATSKYTSSFNLDSRKGVPVNAPFDPTDVLSYTSSTTQTVYDSLGNAHNFQTYFVKTATPNQWSVYTQLDGDPATLNDPTVNPAATGPITLNFDSSGALTTAMPIAALWPATGYPSGTGAANLIFSYDLRGTTQYGQDFGTTGQDIDGFYAGRLTGLSVAADGTIQGKYSNGQSKDLGRLVLATFQNPNGLQNMGGNLWRETADSGQPIVGVPGQGSLGVIQSASVEDSNVDLTAELVDMIVQQRAYQANAQTIKTQDQILQTLVNLR